MLCYTRGRTLKDTLWPSDSQETKDCRFLGKPKRAVKDRIKEHRENIRNFKMGTAIDTSVSRHFHMEGHNVRQLKWMVLEQIKMPSRGGGIKKLLAQKEAYWIKKMNTMDPIGMNDHWSIISFLG
ncbi:hypothetical protein XELAEV_18014846mg [Xenopus laevis]|uniref:Uncharacterized protein n=1 Tax=Xenopus laevis TaxID=8355 RepID=A0A974DGX7_XENLA|nr:hypothetical protein XELAEV_18014846mg [Xenopus laevis]